MLNDLRYALRLIARQRLFAATAIITLALGIGTNTALFAIVNGLLNRPLPAHDPQQLRFVFLTDPAVPDYYGGIRYPDFLELKERSDLFVDVLARGLDVAQITAGGDIQRARGEMVSGNYFDVLGVTSIVGRTLAVDDDAPAAEPVVVISDDLWSARFNRDPGVLGTAIQVDDRAYAVVGVMPRGVHGTLGPWERTQFWVPLRQRALDRQCRQPDLLTDSGFTLIARLRKDVSARESQLALSALRLAPTSRPAGSTPSSRLWTPTLRESSNSPLPFDTFRQLVPQHFAGGLLALGTIVLVIAATNLAGMLAARAVTRDSEIATRTALGAGRWRIARQLLYESLILSLAGAGLGLLLAHWTLAALMASIPAHFAAFNLSNLAAGYVLAIYAPIDWAVVAYTLGLATVAGIIVALGPALRARRVVTLGVLTNTGALTPVRQAGRLRHWIIIPQICLSLGLLLVAGVLVRTLTALELMDHGYTAGPLVSVGFDIRPPWSCGQSRQPSASEIRAFVNRRAEMHERMLAYASTIQGVARASLTTSLPVQAPRSGGGWITAQDTLDERRPTASISRIAVSSGYFETLGIELLSGRVFDSADEINERRVVIVSARLAKALWKDRNPLGRQVTFQEAASPQPPTWHEVIGVVNDVSSPLDGGHARPAAYVPLKRHELIRVLVAATTGSPAETIRDLKLAMAKAAPGAQLADGETVTSSIESLLFPRRLATAMLTAAGMVGLVLAGLGVYGVVSYSVAQRTREIGVRIALGADAGAVRRLVLREGARVVVIGGVLGIGFGFAAIRVTGSQIAALPSFDIATLVVAPAVLAGAVLLACYLPAVRASKTDPIVALREL